MSAKTLADAWRHSRARGADLLLLLALADAADDDGLSFPDVDDLAHKARLGIEESPSTLERLTKRGILKKIENVGAHGNAHYQIVGRQHVRRSDQRGL